MHIIINKPKEDYYCVATIKIALKGNAFIPMQKMGQSNQTLLSSICNVRFVAHQKAEKYYTRYSRPSIQILS